MGFSQVGRRFSVVGRENGAEDVDDEGEDVRVKVVFGDEGSDEDEKVRKEVGNAEEKLEFEIGIDGKADGVSDVDVVLESKNVEDSAAVVNKNVDDA